MSRTTKKIVIILVIISLLFGVYRLSGFGDYLMRKMYPKMYYEYVDRYAEEYSLDPLLIYAVIKAESNFNKDSVSKKNAKGVMQLMDSTAKDVADIVMPNNKFDVDMLFDVETNIRLGTKYLSILMEKYAGNYCIALAAYNAGTGTVDRWISDGVIKPDGSDIENIPYKETNMYVRKIARDYGIYENLYR